MRVPIRTLSNLNKIEAVEPVAALVGNEQLGTCIIASWTYEGCSYSPGLFELYNCDIMMLPEVKPQQATVLGVDAFHLMSPLMFPLT
jgi:hypothetical protein